MSIILPEISAIQIIADTIEELTPAERRRVAAWLSEYAKQDDAVAIAAPQVETAVEQEVDTDAEFEDAAEDEALTAFPYDSFVDFYNATAPKTGAQKAAVAGYWLESQEGLESWKVFEVNKLLKSIGVKVSSMSIVLTNAVKANPALVEELGRLGDGERARKTFRLSTVGNAYVEGLLN